MLGTKDKPAATCKGCPIYKPGWCSLYGSIINLDRPVTACRKRKEITQ